MWIVIESRDAKKQLSRVPKRVQIIYRQVVSDLEKEGPFPYGWVAAPLRGRVDIKIRLNREYRVLVRIEKPNLIVIKVAHRKEVYE